jgi:hypothetical protein
MLFSHVLLLPCQLCSIQNGISRYELIQMVDIKWHMFQWAKGIQPFYGKGPRPLLWAGLRFTCEKITRGVHHQLNYCGFCPRLWNPCSKRNCTLNQSLWYITAVMSPTNCECSFCGCVVTCAMARHEKVENFHLVQSLHHYQCNSKFWWNLFLALCQIVCAYYVY